MMRRIVLCLVMPLLLGTLASCASQGEVKVLKNTTVALEAGKSRTLISARVGDLVKLELPPVELAGYGWQVFMQDSRFLMQKSAIVAPATTGGRPTISFLAVRKTPARTTVRFLLVKLDGAKEANPVDGHDAVFTID